MKTLIPMWAGVECTVNRVGDTYVNQNEKNGHARRIEDLQKFADLGIQKIRYPFLWELVAPNSLDEMDWSWADERTAELKRLGLHPIAGFLHHGSGPRYTSLVDSEFPEKLARYAKAFITRYPWIEDFTPINEPLTTARFSGLYGVWYPHGKDDQTFHKCLINEIMGTIRAMQEIRKVNPTARLIQTDDLGRCQGTSVLQYQIDFENERRWLSFDLLCGRVLPGHKLYQYLLNNGVQEEDLKWIAENPCPPNVLGINHYHLSNRFLDDRLQYYPESFHGGNGVHRYADVGAVDTTAGEMPSAESVFQEVWDRYQMPIAITEIHLVGPRESQMRWLNEISQTAQRMKERGIDFQGLTAWSLLGSFDWNSLCTNCADFYESGVFDIRSPEPRPTALAKMIKAWSSGQPYQHPLLEVPGWWRERDAVPFGPRTEVKRTPMSQRTTRPLLITGANGTLGRAFIRICEKREIPYKALTRKDMDICSPESVQKVVAEINPWAIVNTAGYVRVDQAEMEKEKCFRENIEGPKVLAMACANKKIPFLHFSSDLVFDGSHPQPYVESHPVSPLNVYGMSKAESEKQVQSVHPDSLIVRTSSFFGPWDEANFVFAALKSMVSGDSFYVASDVTMSPTYVPDLVDLSLDLLIDGEKGILHLTNAGHLTWADLAKTASEIALKNNHIPNPSNFSMERLVACPIKELGQTAIRPKFSALKSERLSVLPSFEDALHRYFKDLEIPLFKKEEMKLENQL